MSEVSEDIKDLKDLFDNGVLTKKEFNEAKKKLLDVSDKNKKSESGMIDLYFLTIGKYFIFSGRASKKEYWSFFFVNLLFSIVIYMICFLGGTGNSAVFNLYSLFTLIPSFSLSVRRLHDTNRWGWDLLFGIIPILGIMILLSFFLEDGDSSKNDYGYPSKI